MGGCSCNHMAVTGQLLLAAHLAQCMARGAAATRSATRHPLGTVHGASGSCCSQHHEAPTWHSAWREWQLLLAAPRGTHLTQCMARVAAAARSTTRHPLGTVHGARGSCYSQRHEAPTWHRCRVSDEAHAREAHASEAHASEAHAATDGGHALVEQKAGSRIRPAPPSTTNMGTRTLPLAHTKTRHQQVRDSHRT
eukprot:366558-Chlamydomonas_euryale.AAC.20